jgi:hypothetical protein
LLWVAGRKTYMAKCGKIDQLFDRGLPPIRLTSSSRSKSPLGGGGRGNCYGSMPPIRDGNSRIF